MNLSKKTPLQRVGEDERLLEKIMLALPGFRGYKAKEQRREADKMIREFLSSRLQEARNTLQDIYEIVAGGKAPVALDPIDRLMAIFDRVSEKVNHASYGYAGFFDATKIEEDDLDRMINFDTQLVESAKGLAQRVQVFKDDLQAGKFDNLEAYESDLRKTVEGFETTFDQRKDVIEGVEVG
jgi:ribosomal protein L17